MEVSNGCIGEVLTIDLIQDDITDQLVNDSKKDEVLRRAVYNGCVLNESSHFQIVDPVDGEHRVRFQELMMVLNW